MLFNLAAASPGNVLAPVETSPAMPLSQMCTRSLQQGGHSFDATASLGVNLVGLTVVGSGASSMSVSIGQTQLYPQTVLGTFCTGCGTCSSGMYCAPGAKFVILMFLTCSPTISCCGNVTFVEGNCRAAKIKRGIIFP